MIHDGKVSFAKQDRCLWLNEARDMAEKEVAGVSTRITARTFGDL